MGIVAVNSIEQVVALLALWHLGAIAVPLNLRLTVSDRQLQIAAAGIETVLANSGPDGLPNVAPSRVLSLDAIVRPLIHGATDALPTELDTDRHGAIIFTSGSSGHTKGAILTIGNLYYSALGSNQNLPLCSDSCWLLNLPLAHVGGLGIVWRCMLAGASIYVSQHYDEHEANALIDDGSITHLSLVPAMMHRLIRSRGDRRFPKSLTAILLGGAPLPPRLRDACIRRQAPIVCSYGLTEAASQVTSTSINADGAELLSSGKLLPYRELQIRSDDGKVLPTDSVGSIWVRGAVRFMGYIDKKESRFDSDGWFDTGDLGSLSAAGSLSVVGRKDQMFISGGENIYPQEIEQVALSFPGVAGCACVSQPDDEWGYRPILYVVAEVASSLDLDKLAEHLHERLAKFKVPKKTMLVDRLPTAALGKTDYAKLRDLSNSILGKQAD